MEGLMWGSVAGLRRMGGWDTRSILTTVMFVWLTVRQLFPMFDGMLHLQRWSDKLFKNYYPFVDITFPEFSGDSFKRSVAFAHIESYLSATCVSAARCLRAELGKGNSKIVYSMDMGEEVVDRFEGVSLWWTFSGFQSKDSRFFARRSVEKRSYKLSFHRRHRRLVEEKYLAFVMEKARRWRRLADSGSSSPTAPTAAVTEDRGVTSHSSIRRPSKP